MNHSDGEYPEISLTNYRPPLFSFLLSIFAVFSVNEKYGLILNNTFFSDNDNYIRTSRLLIQS